MTPEHRRAMRREQIERWLSCDMSAQQYCQLNHISKSTFYLWLGRFREEEPELFGKQKHAGWIEVVRTQAHDAQFALAKPAVDPPSKGASLADVPRQVCTSASDAPPPIRCIFATALVEIPSGCAQEDIGRVLSVVSSL